MTRVGASECGQRASFNRDRDLADEPHWCSSLFACRNACGVVDHIDIVESLALSGVEWVDDIFGYHDVVTVENWGAQAASLLVSAASRNELLLKSRCDFAAS